MQAVATPFGSKAKPHPAALAVVALLHFAIAYAVLNWLGVVSIPSAPPDLKIALLPDVVKPKPPEPAPVVPKAPDYKPTQVFVPVPPIPSPPTEQPMQATTDPAPQPSFDLPPRATADPQLPAVAARAPVIVVANCARPDYPAMAARAEAAGTTRIAFTVDGSGHVAGAQVLKSAGTSREHKLLDRAAVDALSKCPFQPGLDASGHPAGGSATVEYTWTLN